MTSQNSYARLVIPAVLPRGYSSIGWRQIHEKKTASFFVSWRGDRFLSTSKIRMELIRRIRRHIFVSMVQRGLAVAEYRSRYPDRWPRLTPDHRYLRRILVHRHQNWNHQHWSHVVFADESRVSPYHYDRPVSWVHKFTSLPTTRRIIRSWPLFLHIYGLTLTPSWYGKGEKVRSFDMIVPPHDTEKEKRCGLLIWSSSTDAHVASGQHCCSHEHGLWFVTRVTLQYFSTFPSEKALDPRTKQYFQQLQVGYLLAWFPIWFEMVICLQWQLTAECQHRCDTLLWCQLEESVLPRKRLTWTEQNWSSTIKLCQRVPRGLLYIVGGFLLNWYRFPPAVRRNGRTVMVVSLNWRAV